MMSKAMALGMAMALGLAGCNPPPAAAPVSASDRIYCAECKAIRTLQAKENPTGEERAEIERLRTALDGQIRGLAALHRAKGEPTLELHPGCDCRCHFSNPEL